jgi:hypothetical protein
MLEAEPQGAQEPKYAREPLHRVHQILARQVPDRLAQAGQEQTAVWVEEA